MQRRPRLLGRIDHRRDARRCHALRIALLAHGAKLRFHHLDGQHAPVEVLLRQIGADHPASLAVGRGHGNRGILQLRKVERAVQVGRHHRRQLGVAEQGIAGELDRVDGDGGATDRRQRQRRGQLRRGFRWQHRPALLLQLLAQGTCVGHGLGMDMSSGEQGGGQQMVA